MIVYIVDSYVVGNDQAIGEYNAPKLALTIPLLPGDIITDEPTQHDNAQIIPAPNVLIVRAEIAQATFDAIEAHPDYGTGAILYDLPNPYPPNGTPDAAEYGKRRSYCAKLGISLTQFRAMFGTQSNPNTRKQGADNAIAWAKTLPKGQTK